MIARDKILHFGAGAVVGLGVLLVSHNRAAVLVAALVAGILKELYDWTDNRNQIIPKHSVEFFDVIATAAGGAAVLLIASVAGL